MHGDGGEAQRAATPAGWALAGGRADGGWAYFPSVSEILVTVGLVAFEILAYVAIVKTFPILSGARR